MNLFFVWSLSFSFIIFHLTLTWAAYSFFFKLKEWPLIIVLRDHTYQKKKKNCSEIIICHGVIESLNLLNAVHTHKDYCSLSHKYRLQIKLNISPSNKHSTMQTEVHTHTPTYTDYHSLSHNYWLQIELNI